MNLIKQLEELAFGTRLKLLTERILQDGAKVYRAQNIDFEPRWFTVFYLLQKQSPLGITEISQMLGISQPAVSQVAEAMVKKGLVKIIKEKKDTRKKLLALSAKGESLIPVLKPVWESFEEATKELFNAIGYDMIFIIDKIERALDNKDMFTRISEKIKAKQNDSIKIIGYDSQYKDVFRDLNYEWLNKYFEVEAADRKLLTDPENQIIKRGGHIFFAEQNSEILGTAALIKHDNKTFELAKMAVTEKAQGKQIGRKLAVKLIETAKKNKAQTLFLETSKKLQPALNLYNSLGFEQVEFSNPSKYSRLTIKMEMKLN